MQGVFPALFDNARRFSDRKVAIAQKRRGIWVSYSWREYAELVTATASALRRLGVMEGEKVLLFGRNSPEWYISELALYLLGASPIALYGGMAEGLVKPLIPEDLGFALVQGREELEKVKTVLGRLPEKVIYWDYRGMESGEERIIWFWDLLKKEKGEFEAKEVRPSVFFVLGSGSSLGPRGVLLEERILLDGAKAFLSHEGWSTRDSLMPFLPPVRSVDKLFAICGHILSGCTLLIAEREETYAEDFMEARPSVVYFTARTWERIYKGAKQRLKGLEGFKRTLGLRVLKKELGFEGTRFCYNIGPLLEGEVYEFLGEMGIDLKNIYWKTEIGPITVTRGKGEALKVGKPLAGREVLVKDGELMVSVLHDGWKEFGTRDRGILSPDGEVLLMGKVGEQVEVEGKVVPFQLLESALRLEPFVSDAFVVELEKGGLGALICPDEERLADWARDKGFGFTSKAELYEIEGIKDALKETVREIGRKMGISFKGLCVLPRSGFRVSEGGVLLNGNLNRGKLKEKFKELIAQIGVCERDFEMEFEGVRFVVKSLLIEGAKT